MATVIPKSYNKYRIIRNRTAGAALAGGEHVCFNSSGNVILADADAIATRAVGSVMQDYASGATGVCIYQEYSRDDLSSLTAGGRIYLGTTAGAHSQTAVSGDADVLQVIGEALSATEANFDFNSTLTIFQTIKTDTDLKLG